MTSLLYARNFVASLCFPMKLKWKKLSLCQSAPYPDTMYNSFLCTNMWRKLGGLISMLFCWSLGGKVAEIFCWGPWVRCKHIWNCLDDIFNVVASGRWWQFIVSCWRWCRIRWEERWGLRWEEDKGGDQVVGRGEFPPNENWGLSSQGKEERNVNILFAIVKYHQHFLSFCKLSVHLEVGN